MNNNNKIDDIAVIGMVIVGVDSDRKDITVGRDKKLSAQAFISYDICPNNCDRESFFCIKEKE